MNQSLHDLLGRGAGSVDPPDFDVDDLVARAHARLARRRLTAVAATVAAVVLVGIGTFALSGGGEHPAPAPPGPIEREQGLGTPRPLVYADGGTIHFGDESFDVGADVVFVEATDDGAVFITEADYPLEYRGSGGSRRVVTPRSIPLWFTDGSGVEQIGVIYGGHVYDFRIATANPGSLVAWVGPGPEQDTAQDRDLAVWVYDTREGKVVARVPARPSSEFINHVVVNGDQVFWEYGSAAQWVRYDVSTRIRSAVSWTSYHADLARNPRMLVFGNASDQYGPAPVVAQRLAAFMRVGSRLVPTDSIHDGSGRNELPTTLVDGRPVALRVPQEYDAPTRSFTVVQWLDNDHLVLFAYHEHNELPMHVGDFLTCPVPSGTCRLAVPASDADPFVPPGEVY